MFRNFGAVELVIILVIVLLIFGAKKLPGLARSLGASTKEFKEGMEQGSEDTDPTDPPTSES